MLRVGVHWETGEEIHITLQYTPTAGRRFEYGVIVVMSDGSRRYLAAHCSQEIARDASDQELLQAVLLWTGVETDKSKCRRHVRRAVKVKELKSVELENAES